MVSKTVRRVSPSGATMTLGWDGEAMVTHVSGVHFAGGSYGRAFQISPRGAHDFATEFLMKDATSLTRLRQGRHEIRVSSDPARSRSSIATLVGQHHELMTIFAGPAPRKDVILDLFSVLEIEDTPDGMVVTPSRASGLTVNGEHVVIENADSTSIDVPAPAHAHTIIPRKAGRRTRHGEVWRSRLPGRDGNTAHDYSYVVGTGKGAAEVVFADQQRISSERALSVLDSLNIAWS